MCKARLVHEQQASQQLAEVVRRLILRESCAAAVDALQQIWSLNQLQLLTSSDR
jgi:hypothetical protein